MTGRQPYANTDELPRGFSNDDDNIRAQQAVDAGDENQQPPLPDPSGERHAAIAPDEDESANEARPQ